MSPRRSLPKSRMSHRKTSRWESCWESWGNNRTLQGRERERERERCRDRRSHNTHTDPHKQKKEKEQEFNIFLLCWETLLDAITIHIINKLKTTKEFSTISTDARWWHTAPQRWWGQHNTIFVLCAKDAVITEYIADTWSEPTRTVHNATGSILQVGGVVCPNFPTSFGAVGVRRFSRNFAKNTFA